MVALLAGKGLALAAGKPLIAVNHLEGHALSPRLVDPDLGFPYLLLLVSGGHCQLLEVRGVGDYRRLATTIDDAAGEAFDKAAKLLGLGYPGGPAIEELAKDGEAERRSAAAPAGRLGRTAFLLRRAEERRAARRRFGRLSCRGYRGELPAGGRRLPRRPHPPRARQTATRRRWSSPAESPRTRPFATALAELAKRAGPPLQRPARLAVHRQCGDDRLGRGRALRRRADRLARRSGTRALAARRKRRKGARGGREGMKLGIIGGGAWGTALAQVASAGGRETMLWALEDEVVEAINTDPREPDLSAGHAAHPAIRATGEFLRARRMRCLARGHSGAAYARGPRPHALPGNAARPLLEGHRGKLGRAAPRGCARGLPDVADGGALRPDLRARGRAKGCRPR